MSSDGIHMTLLKPLVYFDSSGGRWEVPAGVRFNGASIPPVFWSLVGGPFEGRYRIPSIIHDYYCDVHLRPWKDVHRMFYDAMLTAGVEPTKARLMYAAVMLRGPRWDAQSIYNTRLAANSRGASSAPLATGADPALDESDLESLRRKAIADDAHMTRAEREAMQDPTAGDPELLNFLKTSGADRLSLDEIDQLASRTRAARTP